MRFLPATISTFLVTVLCSVSTFGQSSAGSGPPPPTQRSPDPGIELMLPIDTNICVLVIAGLLLGCYVFYKRQRIKNVA